MNVFYPTPLKQIESGLYSLEIKCKDSLELIQKHDGSPACVKLETFSKLIGREGWARMFPCHGGCSSGGQADAESYKKPDEVAIKLES
jgi:hypothetical protein